LYVVEKPILILSGDHDLHALLTKDVSMWKPHKDELYTVESFERDFPSLSPSQYREMLALMGCNGDNVSGVRGIGPKYAYNLILRYGSIGNIKIADDPDRLVKLVQSSWSDAELSYRLVSFEEVDPVVVIPIPDLAKVRRHLFAFGMESLIEDWQSVVRLSKL